MYLGGSVAQVGAPLLDGVRAAVHERALPLATERLQIELVDLDHYEGVIGAAALALDEIFSPALLERWLDSASPRSLRLRDIVTAGPAILTPRPPRSKDPRPSCGPSPVPRPIRRDNGGTGLRRQCATGWFDSDASTFLTNNDAITAANEIHAPQKNAACTPPAVAEMTGSPSARPAAVPVDSTVTNKAVPIAPASCCIVEMVALPCE